jgi:hypothetical protein
MQLLLTMIPTGAFFLGLVTQVMSRPPSPMPIPTSSLRSLSGASTPEATPFQGRLTPAAIFDPS